MRIDIRFGSEIPLYGRDGKPYGFIDGEEAFPRRRVSVDKLFLRESAVCVAEEEEQRFREYHPGATDYDFGGMIFRVSLPSGAFDFEVECVGGRESVSVSVAGMNPERIAQGGFWDAGRLVTVRHVASWDGNTWRYSYVNGASYVDISLEPLQPGRVIGLRGVRVREHGSAAAGQEMGGGQEAACSQEMGGGPAGESVPSIYILGDSTAKSYVFEEAPMSGWGQLFYRMVSPDRARVVNYSNGGRSLRMMHQEGRLNDLLLSGRQGDFVLLQSGHNDERDRNDGMDPDGERSRFGRGSTEEMYYGLLTGHFLPAIRSMGMVPVLVTPVTRIHAGCPDDMVFQDSFQKRRFPAVMRRAAADTDTLLLDLNKKSVEHFNQIGAPAARAVVMSLEPGETPGKTNGGSYANGNPGNHADGTHYKECLSRQYCRMAAEELVRTAEEGNAVAARLRGLLRDEVLQAVSSGDYSEVFPEVCRDTVSGRGAFYRNQIEKMVQLGVMKKDAEGNFHPLAPCGRKEFLEGIRKIWRLPADFTWSAADAARAGTEEDAITRMDAAEILYDAYAARFGMGEGGKPPYMTDYNGRSIDLSDPNYDANLPSGETIYYPLTPFGQVEDLEGLSEEKRRKLEAVYQLGLMRCEGGIKRGSLENGTFFQPGSRVTREKAAKYLYFCFVLGQDILTENHRAG